MTFADTPTPQEAALAKLQELHGKSAYTRDHMHFREVGCTFMNQYFSARGNTWAQAIQALENKLRKAQ
jgi:hypothetical protein